MINEKSKALCGFLKIIYDSHNAQKIFKNTLHDLSYMINHI